VPQIVKAYAPHPRFFQSLLVINGKTSVATGLKNTLPLASSSPVMAVKFG
jgi:hypothetical protein